MAYENMWIQLTEGKVSDELLAVYLDFRVGPS